MLRVTVVEGLGGVGVAEEEDGKVPGLPEDALTGLIPRLVNWPALFLFKKKKNFEWGNRYIHRCLLR